LLAITREVSANIGRCELTHLARETIDVNMARAQHRQYEARLVELGCEIHHLPAEPELPDSVFVEDTAIVLDELAVITRPGADTRRPETEAVTKALQPYRQLAYIEPPGTMDGGDVLCIGKRIVVGLSGRTNQAGIEQLRRLVEPLDYTVQGVLVNDCLHLKSAVTQVGADTLLINRTWVNADFFGEMTLIEVDPSEPFAGNALLVGATVIYPTAYPATRERLVNGGISVRVVDVSELGKAEGGVTCCSLILSG
jgi:dimethylargininase